MIHRTCTSRIAALEEELARAHDRIIDRDAENTRLQAEAERNTAARWDAAGTTEMLREQLAQAKARIADLAQAQYEATGPLAVRRTRAVSRALADDRYAEAAVLAVLDPEAFADPDISWGRAHGQWEVEGVRGVPGPVGLYLQCRYGLTEAEATEMVRAADRARAAA